MEGVIAVHEFHVWQLAGSRIIASAHITCKNLHDYFTISESVKEIFHNEGIHSTSIQPEFVQVICKNQKAFHIHVLHIQHNFLMFDLKTSKFQS